MENGHRTPEGLERQMGLLELAGVAASAGQALDLQSLALELGIPATGVRDAIGYLEGVGLLFGGLEGGLAPILPRAGKQYLERGGQVPREVLRFLARFVDDLHAREALLCAGTVLVDRFRYHLLRGDAVDHAAQLVPPGFVAALNERLALDLFAAAVALTVRLSEGRPAGCMAEEVMAVGLLEDARAWLGERCERGELTEEERAAAVAELGGLFELLEDDDVLDMFAMRDHGDAAGGERKPPRRELGLVGRRVEGIESWFVPYRWTFPTGYLGD